jgi:hypothetical protein
MYFINDFEMYADAPLIGGTTFVLIFHTRRVSLVRFNYRKFFSAFFLITLLLRCAISISKEPCKWISPPPLFLERSLHISCDCGKNLKDSAVQYVAISPHKV